MSIGVGIHWKYRVVGDVDLFEHAERIMDALVGLEDTMPGLVDSAVSADRGQSVIEIEVSAEAEDDATAIRIGQDAVEAAIRSTGSEIASLLPTGLETSPMAVA